jgi:hypothetical protein
LPTQGQILRLPFDRLRWAPSPTCLIESGDFIGVRPLYALPIGYNWQSQPGITLSGDAAQITPSQRGQLIELACTKTVRKMLDQMP